MMKGEFEIPNDIKTDLAYCQQAIANHVKFHQEFCSIMFNNTIERESLRAKKYLKEIEDEILDIGNEQKILFNRLRFYIDYYQLTKYKSTIDREKLTNQIREELLHYATSGNDIRPKNVQKRANVNELYAKFYSSRENSVESNISSGIKDELIDDEMDVATQPPLNIDLQIKPQWSQPVRQYSAKKSIETVTLKQNQKSLLKPIDERQIDTVKKPSLGKATLEPLEPIITIQPKDEQPPELIKGRFNLRQALFKAAAKEDSKPFPEINISTKSPENVPFIPSPKSVTTVSSASNSSADDIEELNDAEKPDDVSQERFLAWFGLCTEAQYEDLKNRQPLRRKRHCTSAERRDYHNNGKYKLYEDQFKKRGFTFLYSPPATRAKKRVASVIDKPETKAPEKREFVVIPKRTKPTVIKPTAIPQTDFGEKVCVSCYKPNNLMECKMCCGQYHLMCHSTLTNSSSRRIFCPECTRKKNPINIKRGLDVNRISLDVVS